MLAIEALRRYTPGFENSYLRTFRDDPGNSRFEENHRDESLDRVRMSATRRNLKNSIGIFPEFIDGHHLLILPTTGRYFQVPYGVTVPQKIDNLLVAGRCTSGDAVSHGAMRNMMACTVTGQGAGVAAALSIKDGVTSAAVDISRLQSALKKQGVRIH